MADGEHVGVNSLGLGTYAEQRPVDSGRRGFSSGFDASGAIGRRGKPNTPERFWARVNRNGRLVRPELGPCWEWTGRLHREGYGRLSWKGADVSAHRVAYALAHGPIDARQVVRHRCDNPCCCKPDHLLIGEIADNNRDMVERGRNATAQLLHIGESNVNAKLTADMVRELRRAWREGESIKSIAQRTGLATGTVHPMLHGRTWKHVADIPAISSSASAVDSGEGTEQ